MEASETISELTPIISIMELTHLGSEDSQYIEICKRMWFNYNMEASKSKCVNPDDILYGVN